MATSGVVLVPAGAPPAGDWPVIAWAHGTSGVARMYAPSLMKDLTYGEEGLLPMVRAGFAVVATDYHGLGTEGPHEYLSKTAHGLGAGHPWRPEVSLTTAFARGRLG